ncbi:OmpP1/FadL family transporter [Vibrio gallaecicus]|uniref:OmpP1/FadL family transporter n=1 Tax=Vibrio gallaecicus TaxID=552386 RepID=A0ABV4N940_9VIBR
MNARFSILSLSLTAAFSVNASGIFLQEAVIANAGTAGAGDGVYTQSAAAMWVNPATMSHMGNSLTTFNTLAFDIEMKYQDSANDNGEASTFMPSAGAFHAHQISDKVHLGLALGAVGGSSLSYGTDWAGGGLLDSITLTAMQLNPSLSYQLSEQWSFGAGAQISWAALEQSTDLVTAKQDTDWAYGFNLGMMYRHNETWSVGASYRSKLEHDFKMKVKTSLPTSVLNNLKTDIIVPEIVDISGSYAYTERLNLLASVQFHRWSQWDATNLDLESSIGSGVGAEIERDWDDVWKFALGADYVLNSDWRLKAGVSYETSPQDDPTKQWVDLPVGEQYRYSVGASTQWDHITVDMFYEYADLGSLDMNRRGVDGSFDGRIHFVGMSFSF